MAFGDHQVRYKSAVFWKTERLLQVFSTGTEKRCFTRFFTCQLWMKEQIGARTGLIFPHVSDSHIQWIIEGRSMRGIREHG